MKNSGVVKASCQPCCRTDVEATLTKHVSCGFLVVPNWNCFKATTHSYGAGGGAGGLGGRGAGEYSGEQRRENEGAGGQTYWSNCLHVSHTPGLRFH